MTCQYCNNGCGASFEKKAHELNASRNAAIARASRPNPLFTPPSEALRLASVAQAERLLEIKSSYLIAFATLGDSFIRGPGLDQVRDHMTNRQITSTATCGSFDASLIPSGDWVLVATSPVECIVVTHPTMHLRRPGLRHVVFLPMPDSRPGFYQRQDLLRSGSGWTFAEQHLQPTDREFPRYWDRNRSEYGFFGSRTFDDVGILESNWAPT